MEQRGRRGKKNRRNRAQNPGHIPAQNQRQNPAQNLIQNPAPAPAVIPIQQHIPVPKVQPNQANNPVDLFFGVLTPFIWIYQIVCFVNLKIEDLKIHQLINFIIASLFSLVYVFYESIIVAIFPSYPQILGLTKKEKGIPSELTIQFYEMYEFIKVYLLRAILIYLAGILVLTNINLFLDLSPQNHAIFSKVMYAFYNFIVFSIVYYFYNFKHREFAAVLPYLNLIIILVFFAALFLTSTLPATIVTFTGMDILKRFTNTLIYIPIAFSLTKTTDIYSKAFQNLENFMAIILGVIAAVIINILLSYLSLSFPYGFEVVAKIVKSAEFFPTGEGNFIADIFIRMIIALYLFINILGHFDIISEKFKKLYKNFKKLRSKHPWFVSIYFLIFMIAIIFYLIFVLEPYKPLINDFIINYGFLILSNFFYYVIGYSFGKNYFDMIGSLFSGIALIALIATYNDYWNIAMILQYVPYVFIWTFIKETGLGLLTKLYSYMKFY